MTANVQEWGKPRLALNIFYMVFPSMAGIVYFIWVMGSQPTLGYFPNPPMIASVVVAWLLIIVGTDWGRYTVDAWVEESQSASNSERGGE